MGRLIVVVISSIVVLVALFISGTRGDFIFPVVFMVLFAVFFVVIVLRNRTAYALNNSAHTPLAEGRVLEALAAFEAAAKKMRNPIPVMNVGYCQLLLWRVPEAITHLESFAKKSKGPTGVPGGDRLAAPSAALAHALTGNVAAARQWLEKAPGPATSRLAAVVVEARTGNFAEAQRLLDANGVVLDQLGGVLRALAETVAAYVASRIGGPAGVVDPVRMFRESSVEALKPIWPELYEFVLRTSRGPVVP